MTLPTKQHFIVPIQTSGVSALEDLYQFIQTSNVIPFISKQQLKTYALKGAVWLSQSQKAQKPERLRRLKKILSPDDQLDFYYAPELLNTEPPSPTLIADFEQYSVWLKPRGMLSQGSKWADHTALYRWIEMHYKPEQQSRPCWIVHRLDRATCGLMLVAHSKKMAATLSQLFERGEIHKRYQANVWGTFSATPQTFNQPVQGKTAISHVQVLNIFSPPSSRPSLPPISRVQITIETGRKHQIRYHLSQAGFPIVGDRLYGKATTLHAFTPTPDLQLTAYQLCFKCPLSQLEQSFFLPESQLDLNVFHSEGG